MDSIIRRNKTKYDILYTTVRVADKRWTKDRDWRMTYSMLFYALVGNAGKVNTGYISLAASSLKNPTDDHFFSPRLVFRAMMDQFPEILKDKSRLFEIVDFCRMIVKVTGEENSRVRYSPEKDDEGLTGYPIVTMRTIDKYDDFGWTKKGFGLLQEKKGRKLVNSPFPLKHLIPDWLTAFEEKCMRHHGYL
jgi:hypothetical protein